MWWNALGATSARTGPCFSSSAYAAAERPTGGLTTARPPSTGTARALATPGPNEYLKVSAGSEGSAAIHVEGMRRSYHVGATVDGATARRRPHPSQRGLRTR